ncbi:ExbD/TolR family protein [Helicobacter cappadocius]|uniref:Biopolymer transporter ExbD n=1 Tax=Helicobacter cappadocius TaxID=3063998 RepID=A0AA90TC95_9HELI|nr:MULTISPECIES: biopolymer transporter ExbD [unclassified Helicobacter]MDO7253628.1 biopolymer transporter ExbD [Helicobacter sp. faydin-H75]MDP2539556.1 biopolymer transporter ExbD [Helicobacter sp. faydin-H76]
MKKMDSMNLVPFIDIMLVLLVIVLTTASFVTTSKLPINIPKVDENSSRTQEDMKKKQVNITISNDGKYYINDKQVSFDDLKASIGSYPKDTPIVLQGDKNSNLDSFVKILDLLQINNLKELYILVEDKNNH